MDISHFNQYVAHKQRLLPESRGRDLMAIVRDIVALHTTIPTTPHLSLWARMTGYARGDLDAALYEQRSLVRFLCMRTTLHIVPVDELPLFFQAYVERARKETARQAQFLMEMTGLARGDAAQDLVGQMHARVLEFVASAGPSSAQEITAAVPELGAKYSYAVGKAYAGEFSIGTRILGGMCDLGLLARARPRGTWLSSLNEYALLSDWLPDVRLESVNPDEAQAWLVRRYLEAFGPATLDDIQWWAGFTKAETRAALKALGSDVAEVAVDGLGAGYLMLREDFEQMRDFTPPADPCVFLLPALDPYAMAYPDRRRFLPDEHRDKIIDRGGNAVPTVWADARIVGAWGQRKDGSVIYRLFGPLDSDALAALGAEVRRVERFLAGDIIAARYYTPFTKAMKE
jgi:uncharacterized protein YcaQ